MKKVVCEIVNGCHLSCPLCYRGLDGHGDFKNMTPEILRQVLKKCVTLLGDPASILFEVYNWGEPLLHKRFPQVAQIIREFGVAGQISTNFSMPVKEEVFESLVTCFKSIIVSCSGMSKKSYSVYHRGGNLGLVLSNLERLVATRERLNSSADITMTYGLHLNNINELRRAREYCSSLKINFHELRLYLTTTEDYLTSRDVDTSLYIGGPTSQNINECPIIDWIVIGTSGEFLLCCGTKNIKTGLTINDNFTLQDLLQAKKSIEICKLCRAQKIYKNFF